MSRNCHANAHIIICYLSEINPFTYSFLHCDLYVDFSDYFFIHSVQKAFLFIFNRLKLFVCRGYCFISLEMFYLILFHIFKSHLMDWTIFVFVTSGTTIVNLMKASLNINTFLSFSTRFGRRYDSFWKKAFPYKPYLHFTCITIYLKMQNTFVLQPLPYWTFYVSFVHLPSTFMYYCNQFYGKWLHSNLISTYLLLRWINPSIVF